MSQADVDWRVTKVGWIDVYQNADGVLLGVPSLAAHDAPQYLKVTSRVTTCLLSSSNDAHNQIRGWR